MGTRKQNGTKESYWQDGFDFGMKRIKEILTNESIRHHITLDLLQSRLPLHPVQPDEILEPQDWLVAQGVNTNGKKMLPFYVYHLPSRTFTTLGAENIHHACNKATKEFQGEWSGITRTRPGYNWSFKDIKHFNEIIKRSPQVPF